MKRFIPTFEEHMLLESPDRVFPENDKKIGVGYKSQDARAFCYVDDKMKVSGLGQDHEQLVEFGRSYIKCAGRFWYDEKIISFWEFDRPIVDIIESLNEISWINIDETWRVDVSSYALLKTKGWRESGKLVPLSDVLDNAPDGLCDTYSVSWDGAFYTSISARESLILESPDRTAAGPIDQKSMPFGYFLKRGSSSTIMEGEPMLIGDTGSFHDSIVPGYGRTYYAAPGRIWPDKKVISFWRLDGRDLKTVISDVNDVLRKKNVKVAIDDSWLVDVASYELMRYTNANKASELISLSNILRDIGDDFKEYELEWDKAFELEADSEEYKSGLQEGIGELGVRMWALWSKQFYTNLFGSINDLRELRKKYDELYDRFTSEEGAGELIQALSYFFNYRKDELDKNKNEVMEKYVPMFEEYSSNNNRRPRWFTLKPEKWQEFYDIIYKEMNNDDQYAKNILETIKNNRFRCSENQYEFLKRAIAGKTRPEDYSSKN